MSPPQPLLFMKGTLKLDKAHETRFSQSILCILLRESDTDYRNPISSEAPLLLLRTRGLAAGLICFHFLPQKTVLEE